MISRLLSPPQEAATTLTSYTTPPANTDQVFIFIKTYFSMLLNTQSMTGLASAFRPYYYGEKPLPLCSPVFSKECAAVLAENINVILTSPEIRESVLDHIRCSRFNNFTYSAEFLRKSSSLLLQGLNPEDSHNVVRLAEARAAYTEKMASFGSGTHNKVYGTPGYIISMELANYSVAGSYFQPDKATDSVPTDTLDDIKPLLPVYATFLHLVTQPWASEYDPYILWILARLTAPLYFHSKGIPGSMYALVAQSIIGNKSSIYQSGASYIVTAGSRQIKNSPLKALYGKQAQYLICLETFLEASLALKTYIDRYHRYLEDAKAKFPNIKLKSKLVMDHFCSVPHVYQLPRTNERVATKSYTLLPEYAALALQGLPSKMLSINITDPMCSYDIPFMLGATSGLSLCLLTPASKKTRDFLVKAYGMRNRNPLAAEHGDSLLYSNPTTTDFPRVLATMTRGLYVKQTHTNEGSLSLASYYSGVVDITTFMPEKEQTTEASDSNMFHCFELVNGSPRMAYTLLT